MQLRSDAHAGTSGPEPGAEVAARVVVLGPGGAWIASLGGQRVTVGRDPDNGIVLQGSAISRRHCALEPLPGGGHAVEDLGSTNGVLVNDRRVSRVALERFDRLRVGQYDLVYLDQETDAARVMDLLRPSDRSSTICDSEPTSLRDRLLWLILMTQELRCEEDTNAVLDTLLEELLRWTCYERVLLVLLDAADTPEVARARNVDPAQTSREALLACRQLVLETLGHGRVVMGESPLAPARGTLCVPLVDRSLVTSERRRTYGNAVRGALLLGRGADRPRELEPEDLRLLRALTRQIATLLSNARLHRQATTDSLTQLRSRACIEQALREELGASRAHGHPTSVVLIDVDDFKAINDTLGHAAGDEVLAALSTRVMRAMRHDDAAGRWGGEEIILVLPATDLEGAMVVARKVVAQVAERPFTHAGVRVTVSAGVATSPVHARDAEELVRSADLALYAAKRRGKNQAVRFDASMPTMLPPETDATRPLWTPPTIRTPRFDPTVTAHAMPRPAASPAIDPPVAWLQCELLAPVPLKPGASTLGRSERCDVVLPHRSISRKHCTLHVDEDGGMAIEDHSTNGSTLNGAPVRSRTSLRAGDQLVIGPFLFEVVDREQSEPAEEYKTATLHKGTA